MEGGAYILSTNKNKWGKNNNKSPLACVRLCLCVCESAIEFDLMKEKLRMHEVEIIIV